MPPRTPRRSIAHRSETKSAKYARERRVNENEAREELKTRLPPLAQDLLSGLIHRSDFTPTTKVCAAVLLYLKPAAPLPVEAPPGSLDTKSNEYNALRRTNEDIVIQSLKQQLPVRIQSKDFMQQSNLNQASKAMVAAAMVLDRQAAESARGQPGSWSALSIRGQVGLELPQTRISLTHQPQTTFAPHIRQTTGSNTGESHPLNRQAETPPTPSISHAHTHSGTIHHATTRTLDLRPPPYTSIRHSTSAQLRPEPDTDTLLVDFEEPLAGSHSSSAPNEAIILVDGAQSSHVPAMFIQDIEQAARRLIAKSQEAVSERPADLAWVYELVVDACSVVEMAGTQHYNVILKKWDDRRADLEESLDGGNDGG